MFKTGKTKRLLSIITFLCLMAMQLSPTSRAAASVTLEAESAALTGGTAVEREHTGYSGSGYVGRFTDTNKGNAAVTFQYSASKKGSYGIQTRYANGTGSNMTLSLYLDGQFQKQIVLSPTSNWSSWNTINDTLLLSAGSHSIQYLFGPSDSGNINLDAVTITNPSESVEKPENGETVSILYGQHAKLSGGTVLDTEHSGYSGNGFIGGFTDQNKGQASALFSGTMNDMNTIRIRYANGGGSDRTLSLLVDGSYYAQVVFPSTYAWNAWKSVDVPMNLSAGKHSFELKFTNDDNGNLNIDCLEFIKSSGGTDPVEPEQPEQPSGEITDGLYHIQNQWKGTYLYEDNGSVYYGEIDESDTSYQWTVIKDSDGYYLWNGATGNIISTMYISNASSMLSVTRNSTPDVYFNITASSAGYYNIICKSNTSWLMNVENQKGYVQCFNNAQPGWGSSQWKLVRIGDVPNRPDAPDEGDDNNHNPDLSGIGADLPFITYEAEDCTTNGQILEKNTQYYQVQSEASGRKAVRLNNTGDYVEFELTEPSNSIVLRYSIPDSADGKGLNSSIGIYVNGVRSQSLELSSKFSWVYGEYPWSNNPSEGKAHRFFDESRALLTAGTLPAGTVVRLQKEANSTSYCIIDLVDMELVAPPNSRPSNSLSITEFGAVAGDGVSDTQALINVIAAAKAQKKEVWIPEGTFELLTGPITVDNVTIRGAGMWYSTLSGVGASFALNGSNCKFYDFAMYGDTTRRIDSALETAFDGNAGSGSIIQNIWAEHVKCGVWTNSPTNGLLITGSRFRNTFADGVNLCGGTRNSVLENSHFRNTGDDSIAVWSAAWISTSPSQNNTVRYNTVQSPWLANGIAVYGGANNIIEHNLVKDIVAFGSGINVSSNFDPVDFGGVTTVRNNTILRGGSYEWNYGYARGAIWIFSASKNMNAQVTIHDNDIYDSTYTGILIEGQYSITNLCFKDNRIEGAGTYGIHVRGTVPGSASFENIMIENTKQNACLNESSSFNIVKVGGNIGW